MGGLKSIIAVAVIVVLLLLFVISIYNTMVRLKLMVGNAKAQIAVDLESRWDALTSIIQAVKLYSSHEADTLAEIVGKRSGISKDSSVSEIVKDEQLFQKAKAGINVVVEAYPDLKADSLYSNGVEKVDKYEMMVNQSRSVLVDTITRYNTYILSFPALIIAGIFGFRQEEQYVGTEEKKEMPSWQ